MSQIKDQNIVVTFREPTLDKFLQSKNKDENENSDLVVELEEKTYPLTKHQLFSEKFYSIGLDML